MSNALEIASLLEESLRTRRDLLGRTHAGVTRHTLARLRGVKLSSHGNTPAAAQLAAIHEIVKGCRKCGHLAATRTQTVFGTGNPEADLMFVGEAPGADEDRLGEPFVGRAGELFTRILGAMGLSRDDVYIANILKCRPNMPQGAPGNRPPTQEEMQQCLPYLRGQIAAIRPRVLVALGKTAMLGLAGVDQTMSAMRGHWFEFEGIPLLPTYHPSYLLRNGSNTEKRKVWEDMLLVMEKLGLPISEKQRGYFLSPR